MAFIPAKPPGKAYSIANANLRSALRTRPIDAGNVGGQVAFNQVRGLRTIRSASTSVPSDACRRVGPVGLAGLEVPRFDSTPVCGQSAVEAPPDMWPSSPNLYYTKAAAMPIGRQLRGFGMVPDTEHYGDTWSGSDPALLDAAQADDVAGNGIFDGAGSPATAHAGSGVFESRFSLPGYLYREQPTQPSEIRDTTTGLPLVYQPDAGGSWYEDVRDTYRSYDLETPRYYSTLSLTPPKSLPLVTLPVSGFGAVEGETSKVGSWLLYGAIGALVALGASVIWQSLNK